VDSYERKVQISIDSELDNIKINSSQFELANKLKFQSMVDKVCNKLMGARMIESNAIELKIDDIFLKYNARTRKTNKYKEKIEYFWDLNNNNFICPATTHYVKNTF